MRTTIEIPDLLFRRSKAAAALRGESLKELVSAALRAYLASLGEDIPTPSGWQSVFGQARREDVEAIEAIIADEFDRIDPEDWK